MNRLISKLDKTMPMVQLDGEIVEPVFLESKWVSAICSVPTLSKYFAHKITRNKNDLLSHVQRIYLYIKDRQSKASYGALVDLFLVLGNNGLALRKRMLASSGTLLPEDQFKALRKTLQDGLDTEIEIPLAEKSLLASGMTFRPLQFVQENNAEIQTPLDALDEAMDYIQNGQLEQAQLTLQQAIIRTPNRLELHHDLLEIFKKTANKNQFSSFYKQLLKKSIALPSQWQAMAQRFGVEKK